MQEAKLTEKEQGLRVKLLEEENQKLKKEIELLNQRLKDQGEQSAIKRTRLEEKLKNKEASDAKNRSIMMMDPLQLSMQSIDVPRGLGRSRSPAAGYGKHHTFINEEDPLVRDLQDQIMQKDESITELLCEKDELSARIGELENDNQYLQEQVDLVHKEKDTSIQLLETQLKRQENEYMQQINLLDSEKQNAKSMLDHLQNVIKSGDVPQDPVVRKLNFSGCLNRSDSHSRIGKMFAMTTPHSPNHQTVDHEEVKISNMHEFSTQKRNMTAAKCRSRNPSSSGLQLASTSIPVKGFKSSLYRESHRSGNIKTLKELATTRNIAQKMSYKQPQNEEVPWKRSMNRSHMHNGVTQDSSPLPHEENPYKRSQKSKSRRCNTSDYGNGINFMSEIHPGSKGQCEDVNGTLINSIVNLFPNKFRSKKGSGDHGGTISSFTSSPHGSMTKQELKEKLEVVQQRREDSKIHQLRESSDSNEIISDSPDRSAQLPYASGSGVEGLKSTQKVINRKSYQEMLETGEIMKNVNGDIL